MWHVSAPHRPCIGHRTGYSLHVKISLHTAQACDCVSRFRGVFAHSYKRCRPRLFLRALMDPADARGRKSTAESGTAEPSGYRRPAETAGYRRAAETPAHHSAPKATTHHAVKAPSAEAASPTPLGICCR